MGLAVGHHRHRPNPVVNLDGETISFTDEDGFPYSALAAVKVDADGLMYQKEGSIGSSWAQIDSTADWLRPASEAPGLYEVHANLDSGTLTGGTTGSWIDCDTSPVWENSTTSAPDTQTGTITLSIRLNGGSTLDTGVYILTAAADL